MADQRSQRGSHHNLVGFGAVITGIALGIALVSFEGADSRLLVQAAGGDCKQKEDACVASKIPYATCHQQWVSCVSGKCGLGGVGAGQCSQDAECQSSCTESATSQGGKISCCKGAPLHNNPCKDEVDGKCNPMMPEMMPMMMMGGMPPMLPMIPMKMPDMMMPMMPMPPEEKECETEETVTVPAVYENATTTGTTTTKVLKTATTTKKVKKPCAESGVSSYFSNLFGSGSGSGSEGVTSGIGSTISSVADRLVNFISGGSSQTNSTSSENVVRTSPVTPSASNAGQITSQGTTQNAGQGSGAQEGVSPGTSVVTGFGANLSPEQVNTSTGPILSAMQSVLRRIQGLLQSIF